MLSVDVGWTVNYSFFTAAGIDRKAPWVWRYLGWGGEGKLPLLRASFFVLHTARFYGDVSDRSIAATIEGKKKTRVLLPSVQKYPNRSLIFGISG